MGSTVGRLRLCAFAFSTLVALGLPVLAGAGDGRVGVGVIGDSYSDEYRFYPPDRSRARNWVEILAELRGLDFGPYRAGSLEDPAQAGYAYNWARSAATSADMLALGQHTGLAAQAARGDVDLAFVFIGGNDFINAVLSDQPGAAVEQAAAHAIANLDEAVRTLLAARGDLKVILVTVPDIFLIPELSEAANSGRVSAGVRASALAGLQAFNRHMLEWPRRDSRVAVADLAAFTRLGEVVSPRFIPVGTYRVRRGEAGLAIDVAFLQDRRHAGTLVQGAMAQFLLATMSRHLGIEVRPLDGAEISAYAERLETLSGEHMLSAMSDSGSPSAPPLSRERIRER